MKDKVMQTNILSLSDNELMDVGMFIQEELTRRQNMKKQSSWEKVVSAIKNYVDEFGSILVRDYGNNSYIDKECDFSTFGEIEFKDW